MSSSTEFDLRGKVALVTGGTRGLGRAMARGLAGAGADVVVASRDQTACEGAAAELRAETGVRAVGMAAHVGRWSALDELVDPCLRRARPDRRPRQQRRHVAGLRRRASVTEELFDKVIGVNLKGPFRLMAAVGERMAAGDGGSIINISQRWGGPPATGDAALRRSEGGAQRAHSRLRARARAQGPRQRDHGGDLPHRRQQGVGPGRLRHEGAERSRCGAAASPTEIVGAALYLASDLSSYTTGAVLTVDGGQP